MTVKIAKVKSVHRLTVFEHYKVCNVNYIVYGSYSACAKSLAHPTRRRLNADIFNYRAGISVTERRLLYFNRQKVVYVAVSLIDRRLGNNKL